MMRSRRVVRVDGIVSEFVNENWRGYTGLAGWYRVHEAEQKGQYRGLSAGISMGQQGLITST